MQDTVAALQLAHLLAPETKQTGLRIVSHPPDQPIGTATAAYFFRGRSTPRFLQEPGATHHPDTIVLTERTQIEDVIHELAHAVPARAPATAEYVQSHQLPQQVEAAILQAWAADDEAWDPAVMPWRGHGVPFVRSLCHLYHRATVLHGMVLDPMRMFLPAVYCVSPLYSFYERLQSEVWSYSYSTFDVIHSTPPADYFVDLFLQDAIKYANSIQKDNTCDQHCDAPPPKL